MMRVKQVRLNPRDIKAGPEDDLAEGEFIVYPSTFTRTPDSYGDVVAKGAFAEGIEKRRELGIKLPGLFGHRMDDPDYWVAYAIEEEEDDHGWRVRGAFDLDDPKAKKTYNLVKSGRLRELSFAFNVLDEGKVEIEKGVTANELRKLEVFEFSFVPIGANRDTSVVAVKSATDALVATLGLADGFKAGRVLSAKNESALRAAYESIGTVLAALESTDDGEPKAGTVVDPPKDEEPAGAKSEEAGSRGHVSTRIAIDLALAEFDLL